MHFLTGEPLQITLALIKPDAVKAGNAGKILSMMEDNFIVGDVLCTRWTLDAADRFYAEHRGKPFYADLMAFTTSAPVYAITLVAPDAIGKWRGLMGPTDSRKAPDYTVRGRYGARSEIIMHNAVHGSDRHEAVLREIDIVQKWLTTPAFGFTAGDLQREYAGKKWTPHGLVNV
jgi:nucleoside diphosphate kinase